MEAGSSEYTTEELLALADGLELGEPPIFPPGATARWTPAVRTELVLLGLRSLTARQLVRLEGDQVVIPMVLREAMETLCHPTTITSVQRTTSTEMRLTHFMSNPNRTTGYRRTFLGNHFLTLFPTAVLADVILGEAGVNSDELAAPDDLEITDAWFRDLATHARDLGDRPTRIGDLLDEVPTAPDVRHFAESLCLEGGYAAVVRVIHALNGTTIAGEVFALVHSAEGLRRADRIDGESTRLTPCTGAEFATIVEVALRADHDQLPS